MSLLAKVTRGPIKKPHLVLVHGQPGVGKSTFAADFPSPIFIGSEDGTNALDVTRFPALTTYEEVMQAISELEKTDHPYKTLVIDSLDWLEPMLAKKVCREGKGETVELAYGGFGKGRAVLNDLWRDMIRALVSLREKRAMNLVIIAHSISKKLDDAVENKSWDRMTLKMNEQGSAIWCEFVDHVLFATFEVHTREHESNKNKTRAYSSGERVVYTAWRPTFVAKSRGGLPFVLPLSAQAFMEAVDAGKPEDPAILTANIEELLAVQKDQSFVSKVREHMAKVGPDAVALSKTLNRLQTYQARA